MCTHALLFIFFPSFLTVFFIASKREEERLKQEEDDRKKRDEERRCVPNERIMCFCCGACVFVHVCVHE